MNVKTIVLMLVSLAAGAGGAAWYMHTHTPEYQLQAKLERESREREAERRDMKANWRPPAGDLDSPAWFPDSVQMGLGCTVRAHDKAGTLPGFEGATAGAGRHALYYHTSPTLHVYVFPSPGDDAIERFLRHEPGKPRSGTYDGNSPRRWVSLTYGPDPNAKDDYGRQAQRNYEFWNVGGYLVVFHSTATESTYSFAHAYMKATDGRKK